MVTCVDIALSPPSLFLYSRAHLDCLSISYDECLVDGADSFREQGITDDALLHVADECNYLSFAHVVEEKENETPDCSNSKANCLTSESEDSGGEYESTSEEEF